MKLLLKIVVDTAYDRKYQFNIIDVRRYPTSRKTESTGFPRADIIGRVQTVETRRAHTKYVRERLEHIIGIIILFFFIFSPITNRTTNNLEEK